MADVTLSIIIPDEHQGRVLAALNAYADKTIQMQIRVTDVDKWNWFYPERGTDGPKVWAEKILRKFFVNLVKCYEYNLDLDRYNSDIAAIAQASESVPDEIIE